jgi:putative FmdB family regulatory protein
MPIYEYKCELCESRWKEMHSSDDKGGKCQSCNAYAPRVLPFSTTVTVTAQTTSAGQRVEKFIEESRQVLKEQLSDSRKEYNP